MSDRIEIINSVIEEAVRVKHSFSETLKEDILRAAGALAEAHKAGKQVFIIGNGGSAADAQHFECEWWGASLRKENQ